MEVDETGALNVTLSTGGGSGGGTGTSASGGAYVCVVPQGAKDGSNLLFQISAPVLAGTDYTYVTNGIQERQLGKDATFSVQGTQITRKYPLQLTDWHEFKYIQGTPNSETGGGGSVTPTGAPILRGTGSGAFTSGSTVTVPWPAGTQAGDLVVISVGHCYGLSVPSGWTSNYLSNGTTWDCLICSKVLTSGDISTGHVVVSASNSQNNTYEVVSFIGATGGIRETDATYVTNIVTTPITTSGAVAASDGAIYFGSCRVGSGAVSVCTVDRGALEQQSSDGSLVSSCLYAEALSAAGAITANFLYTHTPNATQQAIVIVEGL
jgi:hypothetical protein